MHDVRGKEPRTVLKCLVVELAIPVGQLLGIWPWLMAEARYFSMPSAEAGWVVLSSSALNCCPCSRSTTQRSVASRCSPAETEVVLPTTVTKSERPLTCTFSTANPFSGLW